MKRSLAFAVSMLVAACGAPAQSPQNSASPAPSASATASLLPTWKTFSNGMSGITVAMPDEPMMIHTTLGGEQGDDGALDVRALLLTDKDPATPDYEVDRFAPFKAARPAVLEKVADAILSKWKSVARRETKTRHGMQTIEVFGVSELGPTAMSFMTVGCWFYAAIVRARETIDAEATERFFDSIRIDPPWRIETFPEVGLTVSLPAPMLSLPATAHAGLDLHIYTLAPQETGYGVLWFEVPAERLQRASSEEILEDVVHRLASADGNRIDKVQSIVQGALRGREVTLTASNGIMGRSRIFLAGNRAYQLTVSSKDAAALTAPEATRFLDSMRIGVAP